MSERSPDKPCCGVPTVDRARCYRDPGHDGAHRSRYCSLQFDVETRNGEPYFHFCDRPPGHSGECESDEWYDWQRRMRR